MPRYERSTPPPERIALELQNFHPVLQTILYRQGVTTAAGAQHYQQPKYEEQHDPFLLPDMDKAVKRIADAIQRGEKITVFSDYDCDGIPGAVVLADFFAALPYTNTAHYIPHRHYEGFGLSVEAVEKIAADGTKLIITIDCGTSDVEAVARAVELGVDVIITDHHEPKEQLPPAVAIVNPRIGDSYPFPFLCGAAVVFKVTQAYLSRDRGTLLEGAEKWWLDMVGLATLADMVPLTGENRIFAHYGMVVLQKSRRPGLQQLLQKQRVNQRFLQVDDIGFTIAPRINAASRMDAPEDAFYLLRAKDAGEAGRFVTHLETLNQTRKSSVSLMIKAAHAKLSECDEIPTVICLGDPSWRPSLVGLVANKLAEEHNRPAFVWGRDGNGILKGSCRSGGEVSVVTLMDALPESFLEYGGHHASGGFSVKEDKIHTFAEDLVRAHKALGEKAASQLVTTITGSITLDEITNSFYEALDALGPFGTGNEKPLLCLKDITPESVSVFGKTKEHTKLTFATITGRTVEAIAFFRLPEQFEVEPTTNTSLTLLGHLEQSFFMGRKQLRLRIVECMKEG